MPAVISQKTKPSANALALLFAFTYMISYMTRINFGAIVSEMERETGIAKDLLSMSLTGSFITYGTGQIISGICGDRFSPKKLVSMGLLVTICMNLLIPLCKSPYQMLGVWCVNGFAQAFMWPPILRLMVALLSQDEYAKAAVKVSWGSSAGTMAMYLIAPLLISLLGWRSVFLFSAAFGLLGLVIWNRLAWEPAQMDAPSAPKSKPSAKGLFTPMMIGIMLAIVMQGMLRDGVTTWMPSYIAETFHLSSIISILTGVVLPIFSILCAQGAAVVYRKKIKNPMLCAGVIFGTGALAALVLYLLSDRNAAVSAILAAVLTGAMHGVNFMLVSILPPFFKKYGNVSTASGVLNSCTYIGSATSTYGIAVLSQNIGWGDTIGIWFLVALTGTALCLISVKPWLRTHPTE